MIQRLLAPIVCAECGKEYRETGYWRDGELCPACSANLRRRDEERKKALSNRAADIAIKYGLDLGSVPDELPEEIRRELNARNAGRKARKYHWAYGELLIEQAAEGKSEAEFTASLGVSQGLLQNWTEKHPRFKVCREIANELRNAWFENQYRKGMLCQIPVNASMMNRYAAAKLGWGDKSESVVTGGGGEIPVVRIVDRDAGFPSETVEPSKEQKDTAGVEE